jgi:hypothetical protein
MAFNVKGKRRFFAPDKEKCEAFLRAQKNVLEQITAEGLARTVFCGSRAAERRRCVCRMLNDVTAIANI